MPSIMSRIFGTPQRAEPNLQVRNPAADPAAITSQPNGTSANGPAEPVLPLDQFKDVWKNPTVDPKNPPKDPFADPLLTVDPKALNEAVGKMDFISGIAPELITKATTGDAAAFGQVVNQAIQKALSAQVQLAGNMTEGAIKKNNDRIRADIPNRLREAQINETRSSNPVLQHPAAAPMLDTLKRQIAASKPDLSPTEVHAQAESMLETFAGSLVDSKKPAVTSTGDGSDFSKWG